jgi:hypothetical protein
MNASIPATAKSDASSSPDNVNDSMNGDAPTVAIARPAMVAGILPASLAVTTMVTATTSAAATAASARNASAEPPSTWSIARKMISSPCGRSTQAPWYRTAP